MEKHCKRENPPGLHIVFSACLHTTFVFILLFRALNIDRLNSYTSNGILTVVNTRRDIRFKLKKGVLRPFLIKSNDF